MSVLLLQTSFHLLKENQSFLGFSGSRVWEFRGRRKMLMNFQNRSRNSSSSGRLCSVVVQSSGNGRDDSDDSVNHVNPDMWSSRRDGYSEEDFEVAEFGDNFIINYDTIAESTTDKLGTVVTYSVLTKISSSVLGVRSGFSYLLREQTGVVVPDKRRMEQTSPGMFSLYIKLYPG